MNTDQPTTAAGAPPSIIDSHPLGAVLEELAALLGREVAKLSVDEQIRILGPLLQATNQEISPQ